MIFSAHAKKKFKLLTNAFNCCIFAARIEIREFREFKEFRVIVKETTLNSLNTLNSLIIKI